MKTTLRLSILLLLSAAAVFGLFRYSLNYDIEKLLTENKDLRTAITNLSAESQIGYAKVLDQYTTDGQLYTKILFVETDPSDPLIKIFEAEFIIKGDIAFFDTLIVKFDTPIVMEGSEKAIYLWRRIYSEQMLPENGAPIETQGEEPKRYEAICKQLSLRDKEMFWQEIWDLANDTDRLAHLGVKAVYGSVVYEKMKPGLIYIFKIAPTGNFYPEIIPDL